MRRRFDGNREPVETSFDESTRLPHIPMPTAAPGYVMELAELSSPPTPALFARADVAEA